MEDLSSLLSGLSAEDIASLKSIASTLMNDQEEGTNEKKEKAEASVPKGNLLEGLGLSMDDMGMFLKMKDLMGAMHQEDERSRLILALKPHLNEERQKKADQAIKYLKILSVLPLLRDQGIL